jgi:hypothetical protein
VANAYHYRFSRTRDLPDPHRAGHALEEAAADAPPSERPAHLINLAATLSDRYDALDDVADRERAINLLSGLVDELPASSRLRRPCLAALGRARRQRSGRLGDASDLRRAIDAFRAALSLSSGEPAELAGQHHNLGTTLWDLPRAAGSRRLRGPSHRTPVRGRSGGLTLDAHLPRSRPGIGARLRAEGAAISRSSAGSFGPTSPGAGCSGARVSGAGGGAAAGRRPA